MSTSINIPTAAFDAMRSMACDPSRRAALVHDETCMGGLVLVLSNSDPAIVKNSLEIMLTLAAYPEHRHQIRNFIGLMEQLQSLRDHDNVMLQELSQEVYTLLMHVPLRDAPNQHRNQQEEKLRSAAVKKEAGPRRRRNSFFIGGVSKSKVIVLQLRGLNDKDDADTCRNCLLTVKGVISITVDFNRKRVTVRTKPDLQVELLAKAIARTMTMAAQQVIKDDDGNEVYLSFGANATAANKENEDMPDYPEEDICPIIGNKNMAGMGSTPKPKNWNFVKSVGNFLSNSFYW